VDGCSGCGGLWFDSQELNKLTRDPSVGLMEVERTFEHAFFSSGTGGSMQCPRCSVPLRAFSFPHTPNITLDACQACKGIWVDDGELGEIASRIAQSKPAATPQSHSDIVQLQARTLTGFLLSVPCPKCHTGNPASCNTCFSCGAGLQARAVYRLCPRCNQPLEERACGAGSDTKVDVCMICTGVWLDAGEASAFARLGIEAVDEIQSCVVQHPTTRFADSMTDRPARCPACSHQMETQTYGTRRRVQTDRCVNCHSLWLDAGELVAVYELIQAGDFVSAAARGADPWANAE
jgi:Zn-finger nucleic acid-binding protein